MFCDFILILFFFFSHMYLLNTRHKSGIFLKTDETDKGLLEQT